MSDHPKDTSLPIELQAFARATSGDYLSRYGVILEHAFYEMGLLLNPAQLRELCGGGSHSTTKRALDEFRAQLHRTFVQRCSVEAIDEWLRTGALHDTSRLSPKERQIARLFNNYVATLTLRP